MKRILMIALTGVFFISMLYFIRDLREYHKGNEIYESAQEFVTEDISGTATEDYRIQIDFSSLKELNIDIVGWIRIPGTTIDYPLVDSNDNSFYLNHSYDQQWSSYGSIFLEERNDADFSNQHIILYGHNMKDNAMFGSLLDYKNQEYADNHQTIKITLPDEERTYRVFSVYTAHVDSPTYEISEDPVAYEQMIVHMMANSMIQLDAIPEAGEQILTLSTCTSTDNQKYRFVVNGLLEKTESTVQRSFPEK